MARFIQLADCHLGAPCHNLGLRAETHKNLLLDAFKRAVKFALEPSNKIDGIWIVGDLFDHPNPDPSLSGSVASELKAITDSGKLLIIVPGTHDAYGYPDSVYKKPLFSNAVVVQKPSMGLIHKQIFYDTDFYFYSMAYSPGIVHYPFKNFHADDSPGLHIGLLHGSIADNPAWNLEARDLPFKLKEVSESSLNYLALGHYHNYSEHKAGKCLVVYSGTLEGRKFSESGDRFLTVVDISKEKYTIEKHKWNKIEFSGEKLDLNRSGINSLEDFIKYLENKAASDKALKINLEGTVEFVLKPEDLIAVMEEKFYLLKISDSTKLFDSGLIEKIAGEKTVRGLFVKRIKSKLADAPKEEKPLYEMALKLGLLPFLNDSEEI